MVQLKCLESETQPVNFLKSARFGSIDILGCIKNTGCLFGSSLSTILLGLNGLDVIPIL